MLRFFFAFRLIACEQILILVVQTRMFIYKYNYFCRRFELMLVELS